MTALITIRQRRRRRKGKRTDSVVTFGCFKKKGGACCALELKQCEVKRTQAVAVETNFSFVVTQRDKKLFVCPLPLLLFSSSFFCAEIRKKLNNSWERSTTKPPHLWLNTSQTHASRSQLQNLPPRISFWMLSKIWSSYCFASHSLDAFELCCLLRTGWKDQRRRQHNRLITNKPETKHHFLIKEKIHYGYLQKKMQNRLEHVVIFSSQILQLYCIHKKACHRWFIKASQNIW